MARGIEIATVVLAVLLPLVTPSSVAVAQMDPVGDPEAAPSELTVIDETRGPDVVIELTAPAPPPEQMDPGTHFIVELNLGSSFAGSVGFAGSLLLGAGGKLKGFPPVFYLVSEAGYQHGGSDGQSGGGFYRDGRDYADFSLGLRTYVPVLRDVRVFLDLLPGATFATATLSRDGYTDLRSSGWFAHFVAALGVQVRVFRELSAGVRMKVLFTDDGLDDLREALGISTQIPFVASGSITWHL